MNQNELTVLREAVQFYIDLGGYYEDFDRRDTAKALLNKLELETEKEAA
jgi:hypothetical protein